MAEPVAGANRDDPKNVSSNLHRLIDGINIAIIQPTRQQIALADKEKSEAERAFAAAQKYYDSSLRELDAKVSTLTRELERRLKIACVVERDPETIENLSIAPQLSEGAKHPPQKTINITAINSAWSEYASIPRKSRNDELAARKKHGAIAFLVGIFLLAISQWGGFLLIVFAAAIWFGLAYHAQDSHFGNIARKHEKALSLTQQSLEGLSNAAAEARRWLEAQRSNAANEFQEKRDAFVRRESDISEQYSRAIEKARSIASEIAGDVELEGRPFSAPDWIHWQPHSTRDALSHLRVGELFGAASDIDNRLRLSSHLRLPLYFPFAPGRGISFIGDNRQRPKMIEAANGIAVRLVAGIAPGKLRFSFIDPIGLGQNAAPLLALGDKVKELIGGRVWSEPQHVEERLGLLTQHMENVIQKYLRDDFRSLEEYNQRAGRVVEAYRLLLIYDFPTNFTESSARRLASIAQNGPRCGVYPIIAMDAQKELPYGISRESITQFTNNVIADAEAVSWGNPIGAGWQLALDAPPSPEVVKAIVKQHGDLAEPGMRVSAPYAELLDHTGITGLQWVGEEASSTAETVSVPLGPSGAREYQELVLGVGTAHHALIVGQTGSGKSNLLHAIIIGLALKYPPSELELYLIDFKQGVEFKPYAEMKLPHARVIAIQSEREFGLSVLRGLSDEMNARGEKFRGAGVPNISDWRAKTAGAMPRVVMLMDEFRVLLSNQDAIAIEAQRLLDRLVSQGRAFGIHCVLASQTLSGSSSLPASITDQMAIRIVLQCSDADSRLALGDDNPEARLLSRPGEAIYNDQRGMIAGNQRFQAADMGNDKKRAEIAALELGKRLANWSGPLQRPLVFEGHLPARLDECTALATALSAPWSPEPSQALTVAIGGPISVKPSTELRISRHSANNVIIVLRDEPMAIAVLQTLVLAIASQLSPHHAAFHVIDMSSVGETGSGPIAAFHAELPHPLFLGGRRELPRRLQELHDQLEYRLAAEKPPTNSIFLILFGVQRLRDLREIEDHSYSASDPSTVLRGQLAALLREGPEVGIHIIMWFDTLQAIERVDRRLVDQCAKRIVGPMTEQDSHRMMDDAAAAKLDRPHRLIRFDEDRPGDIEVFRPYAPPVVNADGTLGDPDASEPYCPPGFNYFVALAQLLKQRSTNEGSNA